MKGYPEKMYLWQAAISKQSGSTCGQLAPQEEFLVNQEEEEEKVRSFWKKYVAPPPPPQHQIQPQPHQFPEKMYSENVLIQFWGASSKIVEGGRIYCELTISNKPHHYFLWDNRGGLEAYREHSVACSITIQQDNNKLNGQHSEGVISRVFRTQRPEMSPDISYYSEHEYPDKDLALSCGICSSFCFPVYKTVDHLGRPVGVLEFVSTCDLDLDHVDQYFGFYFSLRKRDFYLSGYHLCGFSRFKSREHALLEMDHVLKLLCQRFQLPLAQYWVITDPKLGALSVMYQNSNADFENSTPWCKFKKAYLHRGLKIGEGLVGKTYISHKSLYCMDISEVNITHHPLVHYVRNCGSIACFTIFLPLNTECVLEFFLPAQEMNNYYPLLDSLLATMKEHFQFHYPLLDSLLATLKEHFQYWVASGHQLGRLLSVESSTEKDKHVIDLEKSNLNINSDEETSSGETLNRTPDNVPEIIHLDDIEEQPMNSKEILEDEGTTVDVDHSCLGMILEEAIQHKERDELIEESPAEDVGYPMTTTSPRSSFQTMNSLPQQKSKEATMLLDTSSHKLIVLEDVLQIPNGIILGVEKDSATKTFIGNTLEREQQYIKDFSTDSLSEHFGRPLDDAAKSFGVSRSTFKRKLRYLGIPRWKSGKRKLDEKPPRKNFSSSGILHVQDSVVAQASEGLTKMTVKATYNGVTIRFELVGVSGIAELEQNVIERLHLERESFSIKYQDEDGDWILIACDKDVRECMEVSRSLKKTTVRMLLDLPVNHYAP